MNALTTAAYDDAKNRCAAALKDACPKGHDIYFEKRSRQVLEALSR